MTETTAEKRAMIERLALIRGMVSEVWKFSETRPAVHRPTDLADPKMTGQVLRLALDYLAQARMTISITEREQKLARLAYNISQFLHRRIRDDSFWQGTGLVSLDEIDQYYTAPETLVEIGHRLVEMTGETRPRSVEDSALFVLWGLASLESFGDRLELAVAELVSDWGGSIDVIRPIYSADWPGQNGTWLGDVEISVDAIHWKNNPETVDLSVVVTDPETGDKIKSMKVTAEEGAAIKVLLTKP